MPRVDHWPCTQGQLDSSHPQRGRPNRNGGVGVRQWRIVAGRGAGWPPPAQPGSENGPDRVFLADIPVIATTTRHVPDTRVCQFPTRRGRSCAYAGRLTSGRFACDRDGLPTGHSMPISAVERLARASASPTWSGPEGSSHNEPRLGRCPTSHFNPCSRRVIPILPPQAPARCKASVRPRGAARSRGCGGRRHRYGRPRAARNRRGPTDDAVPQPRTGRRAARPPGAEPSGHPRAR